MTRKAEDAAKLALAREILGDDILAESVVMQDILYKGFQIGVTQQFVLRQLTHLFKRVTPHARKRIEKLSLEQLEGLAVALLDFHTHADLIAWLKTQHR